MQELREELIEAEAFHDVGRKERLQAELEALTETFLRQAPEVKKVALATERLRLNVTRAIKTAIKHIVDAHPALGHHLTHAIKTGTTCSYRPAYEHPVSWQI
jgi:non-specific serine/threonine protein kinase